MSYFCIFTTHFTMKNNTSEVRKQTYLEKNINEILKNLGMSKAQFAEKMGVARQNIDKTIATHKVFQLLKAAEVLNLPLEYLLYGEQQQISHATKLNGFIEYNDKIVKVECLSDLQNVINDINRESLE